MLTAHGVSHPGRVRKANEDRCELDLGHRLFVVADGMGGHNAGEVASQLAVEAIMTFLRRTDEDDDFTWPYGIDRNLSFHANRLTTAVRLANRRVFRTAESRDELSGMGTTIVAGLVEANQFVFANVGDSRIYSFLNGTLTQLTTDDSWVATLQNAGALAPGEKHPMRHVLTNVVGAREEVDVQIGERTLADGEVLLFCSDGLHGEITDEQVAQILSSTTDVVAATDALVAAVLEQPARDNVTALVLRYQDQA
jgi:PPM family protein phosphatase